MISPSCLPLSLSLAVRRTGSDLVPKLCVNYSDWLERYERVTMDHGNDGKEKRAKAN